MDAGAPSPSTEALVNSEQGQDANKAHPIISDSTNPWDKDDITKPKRANPNRHDLFVQKMNDVWFLEFSSRGSPLPSWPLSITINALVSVLSSILKSTLLLLVGEAIGQMKWNWFKRGSRPLNDFEVFDSATRGPLGSFWLLLGSKGRTLASIGAAITILSLALDPMFQQILNYDTGIARTGISTLPANLLFVAGFEDKNRIVQLPDAMRTYAVIELYFTGISSDDVQSCILQPQVMYPSGNCSYPVFDSLAVCSTCANVTDLLKTEATDAENFAGSKERMWNYTLPGGFNTSPIPRGSTIKYLSSGHVSATARLRPQFPLQNFTQLTFGFNETGPADANAMECSLHWCVNRYKSKVKNGVLHEDVVASSCTGESNDSEWFHRIDAPRNLDASFVAVSDYVVDGSSGTNRSEKVDATNLTNYWDSITPGKFPFGKNDRVAFAHRGASRLLSDYMSDRLTGYITYNGGEQESSTYNVTDGARRLSQVNNATLSMEILARALSSAVRGYSSSSKGMNDGRVPVGGWSWTSEVIARVLWPWIFLPAILELASLVFLLATVWNTSVAEADIWKNSSLAVLFHGVLQGRIEDPRTVVKDVRLMEKAAEGENVMLRDLGGGHVKLEINAAQDIDKLDKVTSFLPSRDQNISKSLPMEILWWFSSTLVATILYITFKAIKNIFFHPLSHIPGPKLAAASRLYEWYHDCILTGQFCFKIRHLHDEYGPIIRIGPNEVHIRDSDYFDILYANTARLDKDPWFYGFLDDSAAFNTASEVIHQRRISKVEAYFSKASVQRNDAVLVDIVTHFLKELDAFASDGEVVCLKNAFKSYATDVVYLISPLKIARHSFSNKKPFAT
ncbi:hypothetical protein EG328_008916 [Venturia inaequalis]|uniref:Uncharacterized protein n=1 Tax=Venturia inaequalis TaxID=5025 RepID=A0A8H3YQF5_VENIN|nr:hypothetical protein EG328_008916 [Venturia inaequalis]